MVLNNGTKKQGRKEVRVMIQLICELKRRVFLNFEHRWQKLEDHNAFIGDLKDSRGRRLLVLVHGGVAVFSQSVSEDYLVMIDDFEKISSDTELILAAKLENGVPVFTLKAEETFDTECLEDINDALHLTLQ